LEAGQTKQLPTFHGNINVNVSFQGHLYTFKINLRWFSALPGQAGLFAGFRVVLGNSAGLAGKLNCLVKFPKQHPVI